jgi:hypothetical protein
MPRRETSPMDGAAGTDSPTAAPSITVPRRSAPSPDYPSQSFRLRPPHRPDE